ncbi:MAG: D-amino-acid transaminase [Rhizomicrobium sp.]
MKKWSASRAPSGRVAYVDGRYLPHGKARVHVEDRSLQLGDGIYEVTAVAQGRPVDEEGHLDRLERSLGEIGMAMPIGRRALKLVMREMIARNRLKDGLLYMQVSRGAVKRDHPIPATVPRPSLIMTARGQDPRVTTKKREQGIAVITRPDQRWARRDIKTVQLLPNLLAKTEARRQGAYEAWLVDPDGFVTEGTSTTAWIVDEKGDIVTRPLSNDILPGVTRRVILEAAEGAQLKIVERKFSVAEARNAREAFISSASGAAISVVCVDGVEIGDGKPGPLARRLYELYAEKAGIAD